MYQQDTTASTGARLDTSEVTARFNDIIANNTGPYLTSPHFINTMLELKNYLLELENAGYETIPADMESELKAEYSSTGKVLPWEDTLALYKLGYIADRFEL